MNLHLNIFYMKWHAAQEQKNDSLHFNYMYYDSHTFSIKKDYLYIKAIHASYQCIKAINYQCKYTVKQLLLMLTLSRDLQMNKRFKAIFFQWCFLQRIFRIEKTLKDWFQIGNTCIELLMKFSCKQIEYVLQIYVVYICMYMQYIVHYFISVHCKIIFN